MVQEGEKIRNYMRDMIEEDEVFILLELKRCGNPRLEYNYYTKGKPRKVLMAIAEIIEREANEMGLTFDETVEVMKNMHQINEGKYESRKQKRMAKEWKVIES